MPVLYLAHVMLCIAYSEKQMPGKTVPSSVDKSGP